MTTSNGFLRHFCRRLLNRRQTAGVFENHQFTSSLVGIFERIMMNADLSAAPWTIVNLTKFFFFLVSGSSELSSSSVTLISGFLAVISVNVVIVIYIVLAMKEPANLQHQPDPSFLAAAKASINQPMSSASNSEDAVIRQKTD
ncbi:uncharacterized protein LOC110099230 [Dendrobium catenatum]|uniref:uncharacterized protein LOC110099230 n=1 Tax=Dendrobium catenatum TaxID=906689 RepID=UPI0010A01EE1|nr:uncharacterized protein LOC110099230 [Dendrobium catenatum]